MFRLTELPLGLLLLGLLLTVPIKCAMATTATFTVAAGEEQTRTLNLDADDHVIIHFTITGDLRASSLGFQIAYPNGTLKNYGALGVFDCTFVNSQAGECVLHFSNMNSSEPKLVNLNYDIQHYIFGMPQMLFLVLVVAALCVGAVAVYILMGKTY